MTKNKIFWDIKSIGGTFNKWKNKILGIETLTEVKGSILLKTAFSVCLEEKIYTTWHNQ